MRRRRIARGNRRGQSSNWIWGLVIVFVAAACGGLVWYLYNLNQKNDVDESTLCPISGERGFLALVLDLTDPLNPDQAARLSDAIKRKIDLAPVGTLISVGVVSVEAAGRGIRFSSCKPQSDGDANALYQNKRIIQKRFEEDFRVPLEETINSMLESEEQNSSPIIESTISLIAAHAGIWEKDMPKKLLLVSDLVQHSDIHSFFRGQDWRQFRQTEVFRDLSKALRGFDVEIIKIPRSLSASINAREVEDFWVRYLEAHGVRSIRTDRATLGRI